MRSTTSSPREAIHKLGESLVERIELACYNFRHILVAAVHPRAAVEAELLELLQILHPWARFAGEHLFHRDTRGRHFRAVAGVLLRLHLVLGARHGSRYGTLFDNPAQIFTTAAFAFLRTFGIPGEDNPIMVMLDALLEQEAM